MKRLHLFRTGTHTDGSGTTRTYTDADIQGIVDSYDPTLHEAPIVVGHPKIDAPAYGWVKSLFVANGLLEGEPHQVEGTFSQMVQDGRFKKISVALYLPESPQHPLRGQGQEPRFPYLKHVGFLGATPPVVKGLKPVEFSEDVEGVAVVEFGDNYSNTLVSRGFRAMRDFLIDQFGLEKANEALPGWIADELDREAQRDDDRSVFTEPVETEPQKTANTMDPEKEKEIAAREKQIADQEAAFAEREKKLADQEQATRRAEAQAFVDGLVNDDAKILPVFSDVFVEALVQLDAIESVMVQFGEGKDAQQKPLGQALREALTHMKSLVSFSEVAAPDGGKTVDSNDAHALATAATEYKEEQASKGRVVSYSEAVAHVSKQKDA